MSFFDGLQQKLQGLLDFKSKKQRQILLYLLVLSLCGVMLVVWSNRQLMGPAGRVEREEEVHDQWKEAGDEYLLERRVATLLSSISGTGRVDVQITFASTPRYVYSQDLRVMEKATLEEDVDGGQRRIHEETRDQQVVVLRDGAGGEEALVEEKISPRIIGVLVVAEGAGDPAVRDRLWRAVQTLLDIPLYRIEVVSREGGL